MTRLETLTQNHQAPSMPAPGAAAHLAGYLFELGPVGSGGMGAVAISWPDIDAWQNATGIELATWEARALRRLSQEYLAASHDAKERDCPAPYSEELDHTDRAAIANKIAHIFSSRKKH